MILQKNFILNLNKESVEITKLALWLKTANSKCKLNNLDENIKCGNSLIDDETIAGDKAFKWETEFPQIFKKLVIASDSEAIQPNKMDCHEISNDISRNDNDCGFDVIIGNPPYGASLNDISKDYIYKNYEAIE